MLILVFSSSPKKGSVVPISNRSGGKTVVMVTSQNALLCLSQVTLLVPSVSYINAIFPDIFFDLLPQCNHLWRHNLWTFNLKIFAMREGITKKIKVFALPDIWELFKPSKSLCCFFRWSYITKSAFYRNSLLVILKGLSNKLNLFFTS